MDQLNIKKNKYKLIYLTINRLKKYQLLNKLLLFLTHVPKANIHGN